MTVLVTGGTGFLGARVVRKLLAQGDRVRCFVRGTSAFGALRESVPPEDQDRLEAFTGNLSNPEHCLSALKDCSVVYHIAAEMKGATAVLFLNNVVASRILYQAAAKSGVDRVVSISSIAVYDSGKLKTGECLDENCPIEPSPYLRDPYTYSKVRQEEVAWEAHQAGLPLTIIRPGVIYGPGKECLSGRVGIPLGPLMLVMGGRQKMPYTYVENCASAIVLAGKAEGVNGRAFNIVDDELPTGKQLLKKYRRSVKKIRTLTFPRWFIPIISGLCEWYNRESRGQLPAILTRYKSRAMWGKIEYSNANAKSLLGWKPETNLQDGLLATFEWLRKQNLNTAQ